MQENGLWVYHSKKRAAKGQLPRGRKKKEPAESNHKNRRLFKIVLINKCRPFAGWIIKPHGLILDFTYNIIIITMLANIAILPM